MSLLLLGVIVFPLLSFFYTHQVLLKNLKRQTKAEILAHWDKNKVVVLHFSYQDIRNKVVKFHKEDFEIEVADRMYDVIEQTITGTGLSIKCIPDYKETEFKSILKSQLQSLFSQNPIQKNQTKAFIHFLENLICQVHSFSFTNLSRYYDYIHLVSCQIQLPSINLRVLSPPPEFG